MININYMDITNLKAAIAVNKNNNIFLSEGRLLKFLQEIFPDSEILEQQNVSLFGENLRVDCVINLSQNDSLSMQSVVSNVPTTLYIEFDGYHHYTNNLQASKDNRLGLGFSKWKEVSDGIFGIRIPYFVQFDDRVSRHIFSKSMDLSNGFPHGFVYKNCVTLNQYSTFGIGRFAQDLQGLPLDVAREVLISFLIKFENKCLFDIIDAQHFKNLIEICQFRLSDVAFGSSFDWVCGNVLKFLNPKK